MNTVSRPPRRPTTQLVAGLLLAAAAVFVLVEPALAQEVAQAAAPAVHKKTLFERIMGGGVAFMSTLMLTSVFMFWLILDGLLRTAGGKLAPAATIESVRQHLSAGDYDGATQAVRENDTVFGRVSLAAFGKVGLGKDATDDAIFEQMERERAIFNSRISYLSVIGVITPMIGLTGTVFGMIKAFDTLGSAGVGDPAKLSAAIGTVLVATAGGLLVAIPAFTAYYVLRNRINAGFRRVQIEINAIFHHLPYGELEGVRLDSEAFIPASPKSGAGRTAEFSA